MVGHPPELGGTAPPDAWLSGTGATPDPPRHEGATARPGPTRPAFPVTVEEGLRTSPGRPVRVDATGAHRRVPRHTLPVRPGPPPRPAPVRLSAAPRPPRTVLPYLVTVVVSMLVVGLASVLVGRAVAREDALDGAVARAVAAATLAVVPALTDGVLTGDPAALQRLDRAVRADVLNVSLLRATIRAADGTVLYSDEPRLVGERFVLDADELAALHGAGPAAEVADLTTPENRFEDPSVPVLEVHLPVRTPGGTPLLFEVHTRGSDVAGAAQRIWLGFLPVGIGALVLLELLQLPIAAVLARRLRRARDQREDAMARALSAVEEERARIAGDLHDGVVQDLAGVAFTLGAATRAGRVDPARVDPEELDAAADRVRRSVRALRSLVVEIYPPDLHAEGLGGALPDLAARLVPPGTAVLLEVADLLPAQPGEDVELVYRVAQEALRNVVRHAAARSVTVTLAARAGGVRLTVADDGAGCDPRRIAGLPGHLGLRALGELAARRGAVLTVRSAPGRGTVLVLQTGAGRPR